MALGWLRKDKAEFRLFAAVLILKVSVTYFSFPFFFCVDKLAAQFFVILFDSVLFCPSDDVGKTISCHLKDF